MVEIKCNAKECKNFKKGKCISRTMEIYRGVNEYEMVSLHKNRRIFSLNILVECLTYSKKL